MKHLRLSGLRVRLAFLVLLVMLPSFGLTFYTFAEQRRHAIAEAHADALLMARTVALDQAQLVADAKDLLAAMAQHPEVRSLHPVRCSALAAGLLGPNFTNVGVAAADGNVFCSAIPMRTKANIGDRVYFRQAMTTRDLAIGEYQVGPITGKAALNVGYPLLDAAGEVRAVLYAALDLAWLNEVVAKPQLPPGSTVMVLDAAGTTLARHPNPERWVGRPVPEAPILKAIESHSGEGITEAPGPDGTPLLLGFTSLPTAAGRAYVTVGIPMDAALGKVRRRFGRDLIGLGIAGILALLGAWASANALILRPLDRLVQATRRLSAGDLVARTGLSYGAGELGQLAQAFDEMAEALQARQAEAERAAQALGESERRYRLLFESNPHPMWVYDLETLRFLAVNDAAVHRYGYSRDEFLSMMIKDIRPVEDVTALLEDVAAVRGISPPARWRHLTKSGTVIDVEITGHPVTFGDRPGRLILAMDITDRVRAERAIVQRTQELTTLNRIGQSLSRLAKPAQIVEDVTAAIREVVDDRNLFIALYDEARQYVGFPFYTIDGVRRASLGRPFGNGITEYVIRTKAPLLLCGDVAAELNARGIASIGRDARCLVAVPILAGDKVYGVIALQDYERSDAHGERELELLSTFASAAGIALENARLFEDARLRALRQETLNAVITASAGTPDARALLDTALDHAVRALHEAAAAAWLGDIEVTHGLPQETASAIGAATLSAGLASKLGDLIVEDVDRIEAGSEAAVLAPILQTAGYRALLSVPIHGRDRRIGALGVVAEQPRRWSPDEVALLKAIAQTIGSAAQRRRAEERILGQLERLTALYASAQKLSQSLDLRQLADDVVETAVKVFGTTMAWLGRAEADGSVRVLASFPPELDYPRRMVIRWDDSPQGRGATGRALRSGFPYVIDYTAENPEIPADRLAALKALGIACVAAFPLISRDKPFGTLTLYSNQQGFFKPAQVEFLQGFAHLVAAALENARLLDETERRLAQVQTLRDIDVAISASLDVRVTLNIFLDKVTSQLAVDAADVLLLNPQAQILQFVAGRGFRTTALEHTRLPLGKGYAGRAAIERRMLSVTNLQDAGGDLERSPLLRDEGFVTYYAVPLIAKGEVKGILEVFHRTPLTPDPEWLDFMGTLAGQAAIAIDNASLLDDLQRSNLELSIAYDTTLEGWSKALDLRDKETEGHTQRVMEVTVRLARVMGLPDGALVHVRRGALLHDIGKMGIPDSILLKPGPLTDEEWEIMRKHPVYARELLAPIAHLQPALPIPYSHHEKWDGSGYPEGARGEQIPMEARIFAVVDVWDALTSDRPYRPAWSKEKARDHIRDQAGKHFDPVVVAAFLELEL